MTESLVSRLIQSGVYNPTGHQGVTPSRFDNCLSTRYSFPESIEQGKAIPPAEIQEYLDKVGKIARISAMVASQLD